MPVANFEVLNYGTCYSWNPLVSNSRLASEPQSSFFELNDPSRRSGDSKESSNLDQSDSKHKLQHLVSNVASTKGQTSSQRSDSLISKDCNNEEEEEEKKSKTSDMIIKMSIPPFMDDQDEESSSDSEGKSVNTKKSSKSSVHFKCRNDVVLKTIFRSFRKFYIKDFRKSFDFIKRSKDGLPTEFVNSKVREYLARRFASANALMVSVFVSIIDTKNRFIPADGENPEVVSKVSELMYRFNNYRMLKMLQHPEFAQLVASFLAQPDIVRRILRRREDSKVVKAYTKQVQSLRYMCTPS